MQTNIAISTISLFPFSWGPGGPKRILGIISKLGIKVQLVPLFGWRKNDFQDFPPEFVMSLEGSWLNSFKELETEGKRLDWLTPICPMLFGSRANTERQLGWFQELFPQALAIDLPGGIQEIVSRRGEKLKDFLVQPGPFVFDTWHIREMSCDQTEILDFFNQLMDEKKISLVHLQTRSFSEFSAFMKGEASLIDKILLISRERDEEIGIVFEIPCFFLWPNLFSTLSRLKTIIENFYFPRKNISS